MAIFLKLSSFIGFPPLWFGLRASYPKSTLRVTDVLAQKLTLRVTYVLAHRGNRCAGTWHVEINGGVLFKVDIQNPIEHKPFSIGEKVYVSFPVKTTLGIPLSPTSPQ